MELTKKLDLLMKEQGISKAELSRLSGVPYTTIIGFYEKGYDNTKLSTLLKLSRYFDCPLDYLADDSVEKPVANSDGLSPIDIKLIKWFFASGYSFQYVLDCCGY